MLKPQTADHPFRRAPDHPSVASARSYETHEVARNLAQFAFHGGAEDALTRHPTRDLAEKYRLPVSAEARQTYLTSVKQAYAREKAGKSLGRPMDLTRVDDLRRMYSHIKVHAITGLIEWATSDTFSIPYWDIQALAIGLTHVLEPAQAAEVLERNHVESINALSGYLAVAGPLVRTAREFAGNAHAFSRLGKVTRRDLAAEADLVTADWNRVSHRFEKVIRAKYKHLLFLLDQVREAAARRALAARLNDLRSHAEIDLDSLSLNIGIDGGLTTDGYRPAYEIFMYAQLRHLATKTYSVPAETCPTFSCSELFMSITRTGDSPSRLIDPAGAIRLPWKFQS